MMKSNKNVAKGMEAFADDETKKQKEQVKLRRKIAKEKKLDEDDPIVINEAKRRMVKIKKGDHSKLYVSTYSLPYDKYLEEIIIDDKEKFIIYDKKIDTWEIIDNYLYGDILIKPYPIIGEQRDAVIFPDGVEEYGSLEQLRKEMLEFALEEYDPVGNFIFYLVVRVI